MGGAGRLITINDVVYGIIKEHMVDAVFSKEPKIGKDEGKILNGEISYFRGPVNNSYEMN